MFSSVWKIWISDTLHTYVWQLCATMMSWVGCLLPDSDLFILFAENSQILHNISAIPHSLNFHVSGCPESVSEQPTQLIIAAHNCHNVHFQYPPNISDTLFCIELVSSSSYLVNFRYISTFLKPYSVLICFILFFDTLWNP